MIDRRRLLIVDDEPDITAYLQKQLGVSYDVDVANSGADAIFRYKQTPYDVLLTDVRMPGIDGIQLLQTLRSITKRSQVILMSGYSEINMVIDGMNLGAFAFVTKPLDLQAVEERVQQAIALVQSEENREQVMKELRNDLVMQTLFTQRLSALAAMAGSIAHELYQPLSGISIYCRTLERMVERRHTVEPGYLLETMQKISAQVDKAGEVIDHIREFSAGRATDDIATLALREAVERACEFFRAELSSNHIDLIIEVPAGLEVRLNRNRFEQVIINLVANAKDNLLAKRQETQDTRDHILLQGRESGDVLLLDVIDSGTGIPEAARQNLFDPFMTSKQETGGSGLGLFICQRLMTDMGGRIELLTTSVKGTTFRLQLPC